jgi:hypothetical protein
MENSTLSKKLLMLGLLIFLSISYSSALKSYENIFLKSQSQKDSINPVEVFEQVWNIFNTNYPYFEHRGIDWPTLYKVYRSKLTSASTGEELYSVLCSMLSHLNDGHVNLNNGTTEFNSGITNGLRMEDFSWKLVRNKYLKGSFKSSPDSLIYYGWIDSNIAYLRIRRFPGYEAANSYLDTIFSDLMKAKGIIVEVRGNSGGADSGVEAIASRLADQKRLFKKTYWRMGSKRDFTNITYHYIQPIGAIQFTGNVILLQNKFSESASENFALAMRVLPNVTSVGETTGGCFASYYPERLINGWSVTLPYSYSTDQNDFCWEGIGILPNLKKINTNEDIAAGNDRVLEFATDILRSGGYQRKEAQGSLKDLRVSLVYQFLETSEKNSVKAAVSEFEELQKNNPNGVYLSIQELMYNTGVLFSKNKMDAAAAILELGVKSFPDDLTTKFYLAQAYERLELPGRVKDLYSQIITYKAFFPWERSGLSKAEDYLNKNK